MIYKKIKLDLVGAVPVILEIMVCCEIDWNEDLMGALPEMLTMMVHYKGE